jgi:hypothetical protein
VVEEETSEATTNEVDTETDGKESKEDLGMNVNDQAEKEEEINNDESEEEDECMLDSATNSINMPL